MEKQKKITYKQFKKELNAYVHFTTSAQSKKSFTAPPPLITDRRSPPSLAGNEARKTQSKQLEFAHPDFWQLTDISKT